VIAITLNFKSIEAARAVLLEIPTDALVSGEPTEKAAPAKKPATVSGPATAPKVDAPKENTPVSQPSPTKDHAAASSAAPADPKPAAEPSAPEAPAAPTASSPAAVDYSVLQKAVFTLAGKSREAAAGVAQSFGVKTFKELPADKWADALAAVNAKIAEL
jgi:outer membrane biosynthesis protein TonB